MYVMYVCLSYTAASSYECNILVLTQIQGEDKDAST